MLSKSPSDPKTLAAQALRLRRQLMSMGTYLLVLGIAPLLLRLGVADGARLHWLPFVGVAIAINVTFLTLLRTGANLRFRDPSMTFAQILAAAAWGLIPLYGLPSARPLVLMFYVPAFSFGMLRLDRRRYALLTGSVLALYGALLVAESSLGRPGFRLDYELVVFASFALLLCWIAFFGGFVSDLRRELVSRQAAVQRTADDLGAEVVAHRRVAEENDRLIAELKASLAQVKRLSGLLPICASCKKVRDDQGYWSQIEIYVRSHSEADFTHGLCPECATRLFDESELAES